MSPANDTAASSGSAASPTPSSSYVDASEPEFDVAAFLQECSEFMSQPLLTPSPVESGSLLLPNAAATPPYTSDEGSLSGDLEDKRVDSGIHFTLDPALLNMSADQHSTVHRSPNMGVSTTSSAPSRTSISQPQSQSPPLSHSYSTPSIFSSYPNSYPTTSYFTNQSSAPAPPSLESSPPWQTTDTEANVSSLEVDYDMPEVAEPEPSANEFERTAIQMVPSAGMTKSSKATKDPIPRPPNAWILYRSDMLKDLAAGNDIPNLSVVMAKLGYNPSTSASSDESAYEGPKGKGKGKTRAGSDSGSNSAPAGKTSKKVKKNVKVPTQEFLSLGRGKTGKGLPQADISKLISTLWKSESLERKAFYERRADLRKLEHQKNYPDYKFQPMRKIDKIKQRQQKEREKEEAKRQKEIEKKAAAAAAASSKAKRNTRTRTRLSPKSPYSVHNLGRRPDLGTLGRSLSYSEDSRSRSQRSTESQPDQSHCPPRRDTDPSPSWVAGSEAAFDPLGVYPFPFPADSLPSIEDRQRGLEGPSALIAEQYHAWQREAQDQAQLPVSQRQRAPPHNTPEFLSVPEMFPQPASLSRNQPMLSSSNPDASYNHLQGLAIQNGVHGAIPFIAESLPVDVQGQPIPILGLEDIQAFPADDGENPAYLAEMWWNLQDDDIRDDHAQEGGPSGLLADERTLQMYDFDPDFVISAGTSQFTASTGGRNTTAGPTTPATSFLELGSSYPSSQGSLPPQGYIPMYVSILPEDGAVDPSAAFFAPGFDTNLLYLPLEATLDPFNFNVPGLPFDEQGPFLSTQQPMSPTESWSAGPTPREATFLRASQDTQNRVASTSSNEGTVRTVSSAQGAPRYVSSSAYPPTPLSVNPAELPTNGGINDRTTSFSALAAVMSCQGTSVSDDMLGWDDGDVIEHEQVKEVVKDRVTTATQISRVPTPLSATSPVEEKYSTGSVEAPSGPRIQVRRGRAVASVFGAQ